MGGEWHRVDLEGLEPDTSERSDELLALDEALERLASVDPKKAALVKLRYFGGLTGEQAAQALGISVATAERNWAYAKAWLHCEMTRGDRKITRGNPGVG